MPPRFLDDLLLSEEIRAFVRSLFIGGAEDHPIAEIEGKDAGLLASQRWDERGGGLGGGDDGRPRLADQAG